MKKELIKRITDPYLMPIFTDGQVLQHTDLNEIVSIIRTGINENYYDIQRIINGEEYFVVGNSKKLDGASISRYVNGELSNDDNTIPTSQQVKAYIDAQIAKLR